MLRDEAQSDKGLNQAGGCGHGEETHGTDCGKEENLRFGDGLDEMQKEEDAERSEVLSPVVWNCPVQYGGHQPHVATEH